jgi:enoyl-CoA hydratase/carnithine racemase
MVFEFKQFSIDRRSPAYWRVTFDNPPINLFNDETIPELGALIELAESDDELKVIVFDSANPEFFIAHYSLAAGVERLSTPREDGLLPWSHFASRLPSLPVVTISAIRGRVRGVGSEFVLATDIRFASLENSTFAQIEVGAGLFPGGGALERLPRLIGLGRALEVIVGADDYDAATAERYGWINRAIPDGEFDAVVERFARRVASFDKQALAESKRLINAHTDVPTAEDLDETVRLFLGAYGWPGPRRRHPVLAGLGSGRHSDLELHYGRRLGEIDFDRDLDVQ